MRKRYLAAEIYVGSGMHRIVNALRPKSKRQIPVLAYHRVSELTEDYPFDPGLISATKEEFLIQMHEVKKHHTAVTIEQMIDYIDNKITLPKNAILITFDDGFSDNYYTAFEILDDLSIPATFFVTTDFIDSDETIWYERLAYFFSKIETLSIALPKIDSQVDFESSVIERRKAYIKIVEKLKLVSNEIRLNTLSELYDFYGDPYNVADDKDKKLSQSMSWQQLKEMSEANMSIGSHSLSHPILSMLTKSELTDELNKSKSTIEKKLKAEINSLAFPVGQDESYSSQVLNTTKESGYKIAFSYIDGINESNRFAIGRIHVDYHLPMTVLKSKISLPEVFCG